MDTKLIASVATFRVFSSSQRPAMVGAASSQGAPPPSRKDRMAATPVTEGPLILSRLASNEINYLQVNNFTRAIMPRSRIWRVSSNELVIPASFTNYWLITLNGSPKSIAQLDYLLKGLCKYEVSCDEEPMEFTDEMLAELSDTSLNSLRPQQSDLVKNAKRTISQGDFPGVLSDGMINDPCGGGAVTKSPEPSFSSPKLSRRPRTEFFEAPNTPSSLATPPVTPPSSSLKDSRAVHTTTPPPSSSQSKETNQQTLSSPPQQRLEQIKEPIKEQVKEQKQESKQEPQSEQRPEPILEPQQKPQPELKLEQQPPYLVEREEYPPVWEPSSLEYPYSSCEDATSSSEPSSVSSIDYQDLKHEEPDLEGASQYKEGSLFSDSLPPFMAPFEHAMKFEPRFSHPLIPTSHVSQYYPINSPNVPMRPRYALQRRDLTTIGPSSLHQEVTTVGGYIGLRAVKGFLKKT